MLSLLVFSQDSRHPSFVMIAIEGVVGLIGLVTGAHLFVTAAKSLYPELVSGLCFLRC